MPSPGTEPGGGVGACEPREINRSQKRSTSSFMKKNAEAMRK